MSFWQHLFTESFCIYLAFGEVFTKGIFSSSLPLLIEFNKHYTLKLWILVLIYKSLDGLG